MTLYCFLCWKDQGYSCKEKLTSTLLRDYAHSLNSCWVVAVYFWRLVPASWLAEGMDNWEKQEGRAQYCFMNMTQSPPSSLILQSYNPSVWHLHMSWATLKQNNIWHVYRAWNENHDEQRKYSTLFNSASRFLVWFSLYLFKRYKEV